jgi:hypothetical protein
MVVEDRSAHEALLGVHFPAALAGDLEAAELCRRLLLRPDVVTPVDGGGGVADAGSDVEALRRLAQRLAREMDAASSPRVLASLSRQFVAVVAQLGAMGPAVSSEVDEIAQRRARRQSAARAAQAKAAERS